MSSTQHKDVFFGKRITQVGLGLLGRGVGDAAFLAQCGAELTVTDMKKKKTLAPSLAQLTQYKNISYTLGEHTYKDFECKDLILKGAGVPLDSPYVQHARAKHIPVDMSASLFARITKIPLVGVTGTRGKSTVTHLVANILRAEGRDVLLGGNVRGVSNLQLFSQYTQNSVGVFELDSWQCQGFGETQSLDDPRIRQGAFSPNVAVFTTFMPDHMNYYRGDVAMYFADKAHVFLHQSEDDVCVVGSQALPALQHFKVRPRAHVVMADETVVPKTWRIALPGVHNRYNVGVAIATARAYGVDDEVIRYSVERYTALPGRLEYRSTIHGVDVYNDTNATTPDATAAALHALDSGGVRRVVLIAGGSDKDLDTQVLKDAIDAHARAVFLLPGSGTDRLLKEHGPIGERVGNLSDAVRFALEAAREGDVVVLSPAFASFGVFANEYDRGEQFNALVADVSST